ncbi:Apoptosis inhibitor 5 [Podila humilis]|nr:Apoptosis inhibitor 5 [Podila humilis]
MADLDAIYNAYNEITDAKENASQIRQQAIKLLPALCKDGPQHTVKIADALCQLLQLDDEDLSTAQTSLETILSQQPRDVLTVLFQQIAEFTDLRDRALEFVSDRVIVTKDLFKDPELELFLVEKLTTILATVSDEDFATFAKLIMNSGAYKSGRLDLANLLVVYVSRITFEKPFDAGDDELIKRILSSGKFAMPLFKRTISADPLLEFYAQHILPLTKFKKVDEKRRVSLLRLYADSITTGFPSTAVIQQAAQCFVELLTGIIPAQQTDTSPLDFKMVECLTAITYYIAVKNPEVLENPAVIARIRQIYKGCLDEMSRLRTESDESKKKAMEEVCRNSIIVAQELMKPRHARTRLTLIPSWTPKPSRAVTARPFTATSKAPVSVSNPATTAVKTQTAKNTTNQQQSRQPNQTVGNGKRKSEHDTPQTNPKRPKILRRSISNTINVVPRSNSPGHHGNKGQQHQYQQHQQHQQHAQHQQHQQHQQQSQHVKQQGRHHQTSVNQRKPSPPSRGRTFSGGQGKKRISFLQR